MSVETLLRTGRSLFEQKYLNGPNQIYKALFRNEDMDDSATFLLDEFIDAPYAVAYRDKNNQAHVRNYEPGSGTLYEPPIASEKTPIDEKLRDQAVEGVEATSGFSTAQMRKTDKIIGIHTTAHNMTKNKQAIDVLRTGIFYAKGIGATDIGKNENFARIAGNDITADFSAVSIDDALKAGIAQLRSQGCPLSNMAVILGADWQAELEKDTTVLTKMQANTSNVVVELSGNPGPWQGVEGLYWIGRYRPAGAVASLDILSYSPGVQYKEDSAAAGVDFMPSTEMVMFSFDSPTFRVFRGVDIVGETGNDIQRVSGELVMDSYISGDPPAEFLRSTTRHMFVYGNINHTLRSTGSNFN